MPLDRFGRWFHIRVASPRLSLLQMILYVGPRAGNRAVLSQLFQLGSLVIKSLPQAAQFRLRRIGQRFLGLLQARKPFLQGVQVCLESAQRLFHLPVAYAFC